VKKKFFYILIIIIVVGNHPLSATELSEKSFLIAKISPANLVNNRLWNFIESSGYSGLEINAEEREKQIYLSGSGNNFSVIIDKIKMISENNPKKIIPVFINYDGDISLLDSLLSNSAISSNIFYLPRGEAWPPINYLLQSNRRIIFFVSGNINKPGRILHPIKNYILYISASGNNTEKSKPPTNDCLNTELLMVDKFNELPVNNPAGSQSQSQNLVPDYINFLLETWTRSGKKPNFIFTGKDILKLNFIISQLNSFTYIKGTAMTSGKILEKVYWRNPEMEVTGGRFSFPYRGGEELTLTPFVPGYRIIPEQIIVTGEMEIPESYSVMAIPLKLSDKMTGSFSFNGSVSNFLSPYAGYSGDNYLFTEDIVRGTVLKLPENSKINLGSPDDYGLRNSSFTVSCFVKFNEILEFGDNAVLGNYENEYRRGLHLILRSGHPYFGLWSNDYVSGKKLEPNVWYHMVWRYMIETGEQAIFLNGNNIGSSDGHPPFFGTSDIHLGSALSRGASLRGYIDDLYFWSRPLGTEEINRLTLNENIYPDTGKTYSNLFQKYRYEAIIIILFAVGVIISLVVIVYRKNASKKTNTGIIIPDNNSNRLNLFGGFNAIDKEGNDITHLFTPKVRELFLFTFFATLKNKTGASVNDINKHLWPGISLNKVNNNRSVTLNKLRKILNYFEGIEMITSNGFLRSEYRQPFYCDYAEAYKLCRAANGMDKKQLESFFILIKKGRLLKDTHWNWLDEIIGFIGNQVIDNLLKLASNSKNENNLSKIDAIADRILEYDDLNEEAIWLKSKTLLDANNVHLAKFHFESFSSRYKETFGEPYPKNFNQFIKNEI